jgi:hypothetical protein
MNTAHGCRKKWARDKPRLFGVRREFPAPLDDLKGWSHDPRYVL